MPLLAFVASLSALVVSIYTFRPDWLPRFDGGPFALLGITLSIFLAFRNNACFARWWEARKVWGELMHTTRNLARLSQILDTDDTLSLEREQLLKYTIAYAYALLRHLRPGNQRARVTTLLPQAIAIQYEQSKNPPEVILSEMTRLSVNAQRAGRIDTIQFQLLQALIEDLSGIQAACERIKNTPVPFGYTLLLHRTAYVFCFLMPFCFANSLGWATPFVTALAAYTLFGLDALGNELEEPFAPKANALPINALTEIIEIELREAMGESDLPEMPTADKFVLM